MLHVIIIGVYAKFNLCETLCFCMFQYMTKQEAADTFILVEVIFIRSHIRQVSAGIRCADGCVCL